MPFDLRSSFLLNTTLVSLENISYGIFIGTNLRLEIPLVSSRLRKSFLNNNTKFYSLGLSVDI